MTERFKVPVIKRTPQSVALAHALVQNLRVRHSVDSLMEITGFGHSTVSTTLRKWTKMGLLISRRVESHRLRPDKARYVYRVVLQRRRVLEGLAVHYPIG